ncbi:MAG: NAD(P)-dependent oxidoreductase [Terrimicrobiaceae bacterium]|jgi:3-hydroxyisobutyrate dehydrogenase-like beta-hydroxyacid dehydrogenase|nr:NAD(P)-dependent oxidoreductase [Terrimicrobiaceae bacterium]
MGRQAKPTAGVIGLGIIGSRVVSALRKSGYQVWIYNRSPRPEPNFLSSPAEVAEAAKHIQIFVSDGPALLSVVTSLLPALTPDHVVMNHATISPHETREAAEIVASRHAKFLDAPFTGSRDAAGRGELIYYIGGDPAVLAMVRPVLQASSKEILEIGEIGQATIVKIATNLISATAVEALAEAHALLDKNGIDLRKLSLALRSNAAHSPLADLKIPGMISGDFEPRFSLKHMFKDVQLALGLAAEKEIDLPAASAFAGAAMAGIQQGWGDSDFSVISRFYGFPGQGHALPGVSAEAAAPAPVATATKAARGWSLFRGGK